MFAGSNLSRAVRPLTITQKMIMNAAPKSVISTSPIQPLIIFFRQDAHVQVWIGCCPQTSSWRWPNQSCWASVSLTHPSYFDRIWVNVVPPDGIPRRVAANKGESLMDCLFRNRVPGFYPECLGGDPEHTMEAYQVPYDYYSMGVSCGQCQVLVTD